jgi:thioredoxin-related protein
MNTLEYFFKDLGFSFALAQMVPYLLMVGIGGILGGLILKYSTLHGWKLWTVVVLVLVHPFTIYFALFPIYQGDLIDLSYTPKTTFKVSQSKKMVVIALPGCKYCAESTQQMKGIQTYTEVPIEYWVLGADTTDLKMYQALVGNQIKCTLKPNLSEVLPITQGSFPTFVLIDHGKIIKAWHNDTFGVRALSALN